MTRIIIATDFSPNALHAAQYAFHLFGNIDVTYVLVHAHFDPGTLDPTMPAYTPQLIETSRNGLRAAAMEFVELNGAASVEHQLLLGPLPEALRTVVEDKGADALVLGSKGRSGSGLFGSNTNDVIRNSVVPVIAVPSGAELNPIARLLFADDQEEIEPRSMALLRLIALRHKSEVLVTHVANADRNERSAEDGYVVILHDIPYRFLEPRANDVVDGLLAVASSQKADMIVVLHRHIGLLGRLLHPSVAKELALDSVLPLLVLEQEG